MMKAHVGVAFAAAVVLGSGVSAVAEHRFTDVPDDNQFAEAIAWAADNGITVGCDGQGNFCPSDFTTREQMVEFLYRLSGDDPDRPNVVDADTVDGLDSTELRGQDGARGPVGARGDQGPSGPPGQNGTNGTNGTSGAQGEQGPAGDSGTQVGIVVEGFLASGAGPCAAGNCTVTASGNGYTVTFPPGTFTGFEGQGLVPVVTLVSSFGDARIIGFGPGVVELDGSGSFLVQLDYAHDLDPTFFSFSVMPVPPPAPPPVVAAP